MTEINDDLNPLALGRPAWNPYRHSARIILDRLKWDLNPLSWSSRSRIESWHNKYLGQKAVIVCNGPSLLKTDFTLLRNVFTFGLNKINLLFDKSDFRPSCIVSVNKLVLEQNADFYNQTNVPLFLDMAAISLVKNRSNVAFLYPAPILSFARDCSFGVYQGYTVTNVALQLAFHMGFKEVALIGADHTFATKGRANKTVISGDKDHSHFDPRYFSRGVKWQLPDILQSEVSYNLARDVFEAHDRRVYNATEGGELELFERKSLTDFVGK